MYSEPNGRVRVLDNGLTVAMEHLPYLHSASIGVWIKTGSGNERPEQAGISHFLEHLFFKGTERRSARDLMDAIESKGGHLNAFTGREYTCLYARTLSAHAGMAIEILGDILKHSTFKDFEKERGVILEEIASSLDVPEEYVHDVLSHRVWPDHALGRPIAGSRESVSAIAVADVRAYQSAWYRPENICVSVAGNFDEKELLDQIEGEFGGLARGASSSNGAAPEFCAGVEMVERPIAQNHVAFAFPGPTVTSPERYVYDLLSNVLGGGSTSRLFERIREEEGLAYSIYSFHSGYLSTGMLGVYAAISPDNLDKTLELAVEELKKLCAAPVSKEELSSNAEQLKGGLLLALEGTFNRMARMARSLIYFDRILPIQEVIESVDSVTSEDIQELAQRIFTRDQCALAIVGPKNGGVPELAL